MTSVRLVIAGQDDKGKSHIAVNEMRQGTSFTLMPPEFQLIPLWHTDGPTTVPAEVPIQSPMPKFYPAPDGVRFGISVHPPDASPARSLDEAEQIVAQAELEEQAPGLLSYYDPHTEGFHQTDTIDFITVLDGVLHVETEDGEITELPAGTCFVQTGTRHAWHNYTDKPVTTVSVKIGARRIG